MPHGVSPTGHGDPQRAISDPDNKFRLLGSYLPLLLTIL